MELEQNIKKNKIKIFQLTCCSKTSDDPSKDVPVIQWLFSWYRSHASNHVRPHLSDLSRTLITTIQSIYSKAYIRGSK